MGKAPTTFESAFNTYSVSEVIGEGGSGRVFAVKDDDGQIFACFLKESTLRREKDSKTKLPSVADSSIQTLSR